MSEARLQAILRITAALLLVGFCLAPVVWMAAVSISRHPDFLLPGVAFTPTGQHFADVLGNANLHIPAYLGNSLLVSAVSAAAATAAAGLAAYAVTRLRFPGRVLIPMAVLAFSMFPQISIVGYLFKLMTRLGWINTPLALVFPYTTLGLPLALWVMMSYLKQIPLDLDRAALVDGASRLQVLRRVVLPLAMPGCFPRPCWSSSIPSTNFSSP